MTEFSQISEEITVLFKLFQNIEEKGMLTYSMGPRYQDQTNTSKKKKKKTQKTYRLISLMNADAKFLSKLLVN